MLASEVNPQYNTQHHAASQNGSAAQFNKFYLNGIHAIQIKLLSLCLQMMVKRIGQFVAWLTVLVVILGMISAFTWNTGLAGSGLGTGVFSYHLNARIQLWHDDENAYSGTVTVVGKAAARFMTWGRVSPKYRKVEIDWAIFRNGQSTGQAIIDLEHNQIFHDGRTFPLNPDALCNLVGIPNETETESAICTALDAFLQSARDGTLPKPNHHSYSLAKPLEGRLQHGATGFSLRPLELVWVAVWSIFGVSRCVTSKHPRNVGATQA